MGSIRKQENTACLMRILKDYVELICGLGQCTLKHRFQNILEWNPTNQITSLGKFLHESGASIMSSHPRVVTKNNKMIDLL